MTDNADIMGRVPPQDIEAEMCVLGSMLLDPIAVNLDLKAEQFYRPAHQIIFAAIQAMKTAGSPVDLVTVRAELERGNRLAQVGGIEYVVGLVEGVPSAANAEYYAKTVRDKATLRSLIVMASELARDSYEPAADIESLLAKARDGIFGLHTGDGKAGSCDMWQAAQEAAQYADDVHAGKISSGLMTGIASIDAPMGGMQPGDLWVLGADTSIGKTALAVQIAASAADAGNAVFCVSAEMTKRQYANRVMQSKGRIDGGSLKSGNLDQYQYESRCQVIEKLKAVHFAIYDQSTTMAQVQALVQLRGIQWNNPVRLVVVDYLQLMRASGGQNRAQEISNIAWACKTMGMKLGCSVLLLSQLDRASVKGTTQPPGVHSLKESGDIENHANGILLLHRPNGNLGFDGCAEIWARMAKNRDGERTPWPPDPNGIILRFNQRFTRFEA